MYGTSGVLNLAGRTSSRYGKLGSQELERIILDKIRNSRTLLGPRPGVDFGIYSGGAGKIIATTDPLSCHRPLGLDFAARFGFHIVMTDFMASANVPDYMTVTLTLPTDFSNDSLEEYWDAFTREAEKWSVDIVTGHTGRYPSSSLPLIGSLTMIGTEKTAIPDFRRTRSEDQIYVMGIPGIQAAVVMASYGIGGDPESAEIRNLMEMKEEMIPSYRTKNIIDFHNQTNSVLFIHDVTEGGMVNASNELSSLVGMDIHLAGNMLNSSPLVCSYLEKFGINPLETTGEGCILVGIMKEFSEEFEKFMSGKGIRVSRAGYFSANKGGNVFLDGQMWDPIDGDPYWGAIKK